MWKIILKYQNIILFCIIYGFSFVFMGELVNTVNPILATFFTYSISMLYFVLINFKAQKKLISVIHAQPKLVFSINLSTLVNTVVIFFVLTFVSPLVYVLVFFGSIPLFQKLVTRQVSLVSGLLDGFVSILAIILALHISDNSGLYKIIGISLTLFSVVFAALYIEKSSDLSKRGMLSASEILSLRFFLTVIFTGLYSLAEEYFTQITFNELWLILVSAITGSILPLFILQRSIHTLGSRSTAIYMPVIPIFSMILMVIMGSTFSSFQITFLILFAVFFLMRNLIFSGIK